MDKAEKVLVNVLLDFVLFYSKLTKKNNCPKYSEWSVKERKASKRLTLSLDKLSNN